MGRRIVADAATGMMRAMAMAALGLAMSLVSIPVVGMLTVGEALATCTGPSPSWTCAGAGPNNVTTVAATTWTVGINNTTAVVAINNNSNSNGTVTLNAGQTLGSTTGGITVGNTTAGAGATAVVTVNINGTLTTGTGNFDGVDLASGNSNGGTYNVTVGATGTITGGDDGIVVRQAQVSTTITNNGTIQTTGSSGSAANVSEGILVATTGTPGPGGLITGAATVINNGTINSTGGVLAQRGAGVTISAAGAISVTNNSTGVITGGAQGINLFGGANAITVNNAGTIAAQGGPAAPTGSPGAGISASTAGAITINNAIAGTGGTITGSIVGINATTSGGNIQVTVGELIRGGTGNGVNLTTTGAGNSVTLQGSSGVVHGGVNGAVVTTNGGTAEVLDLDLALGDAGNGVLATSSGGAININDNTAIQGGTNGINANSNNAGGAGGAITIQGNGGTFNYNHPVDGPTDYTDIVGLGGAGIIASANGTGAAGGTIQVGGAGALGNATITGSTVGMSLTSNGTVGGTVNVQNNTAITGQGGNGITVVANGSAGAGGNITIGGATAGLGNGDIQGSVDGVNLTSNGTGAAGGTILVQNNTSIVGVGGGGIEADSGGPGGAGGNITILGNATVDGQGGNGILANAEGLVTGGVIQVGDLVGGGNGLGTFVQGSTNGMSLTTNNNTVNVQGNGIITGLAGHGIAINTFGGSTSGGSANVQGNTGAITGTGAGSDGINVLAGAANAGGDITISDNTGPITGDSDGLDLSTAVGGSITVTDNTGLISGTTGNGIAANTAFDPATVNAGNITITGNTGGVTGGDDGISASAVGTTTGGVIVVGATGAGNGAIQGGLDGLDLTTFDDGTAAVDISVVGNTSITGLGGHGIRASSGNNGLAANGGDISIQGNGAISGSAGFDGIGVNANGTVSGGNIAIGNLAVNTSTISGGARGITAVTNFAGMIDITTGTGAVSGTTSDGIFTQAETGTTTINLGGNVNGNIAGAVGDGINARSTTGTITIGVAGGAPVTTGGDDGMDVATTGGDIGITTGGLTQGLNGNGILTNSGTGATTITLGGAATGAEDGINATVIGAGTITIAGTGAVTGTNSDGIETNAVDGLTSITQAGVVTGDPGMNLNSVGGQIDLFGSGNVIGTVGEGALITTATGIVNVNRAGAFTGATDGISVTSTGGSVVTIVTNGNVTGTAGEGIEVNNAGAGTTSVTIAAGNTVQGGTTGLLNEAGALTATNNGTLTGPVAINVLAGTSNFTNTATGIGNGMLASLAGATSTQLTNNAGGQWNFTPGGSSTLASASDTITNRGIFRYSGATTTLTGLETFDNTAGGQFNVLGNGGGAAQAMNFAGATNFMNAGGFINLQNGVVNDSVMIAGNYDATGGGTVNLDINLGAVAMPGNMLADKIIVGGTFTGHTTFNFNNVSAPIATLQPDILVADLQGGAGDTGTWDWTGLPAGLVTYAVVKDGAGDLVVRSSALAAIGGIAGNVAVVQSTLGAIVNRPSSPFVSGLAVEVEPGYCGPGVWMRGTGGAVNADGTSTSAQTGLSSTTTVGLRYAGAQFGTDLACFNLRESGIDVSVGAIAGYNTGAASQALPFGLGITNSSFDQGYGGLYATVAKGQFSADVQARVDATRFTFNNPNISLNNATLDTVRTSLSGSASYALPFGEMQDSVFVPTAGFSASRTTSGALAFNPIQNLQPMASLSLVGFAGATVAKTFVQPDQVSAVQPFATATVYNDFAPYPVAVFTDTSTGTTETVTSTHLGAIGEISVGTNFFRIFEGDPKQLNATVRIDTRFSSILLGAGITAQLRAQF